MNMSYYAISHYLFQNCMPIKIEKSVMHFMYYATLEELVIITCCESRKFIDWYYIAVINSCFCMVFLGVDFAFDDYTIFSLTWNLIISLVFFSIFHFFFSSFLFYNIKILARLFLIFIFRRNWWR